MKRFIWLYILLMLKFCVETTIASQFRVLDALAFSNAVGQVFELRKIILEFDNIHNQLNLIGQRLDIERLLPNKTDKLHQTDLDIFYCDGFIGSAAPLILNTAKVYPYFDISLNFGSFEFYKSSSSKTTKKREAASAKN